ncbi:MAG: 2-oxoacid:acceptor oxidoreductase family protein [Gammaproteobacteria bacterium]|jgi:pyruvate ferredoxin oxidoreductase gamma subunit|nr:2-oxoacid:acceptor oxidoreductase family protein [Gammaproteobacteria bacterium]MBP6052987.1 2-oxoacid:acceptor oxidoreductase family protein [Pseudomonadales bacterium]MBK6584007.1 2-oxoacid:acceptor oxidoreductase family protein [Gammaproteobacteria bacterium]MBK7169281.1 2-oxoacid:acceptor oxidoreductase family protein [Gammaproteobacteria bacterium]MBK7522512.1 2-oxoacid:acceptor oxidoreductase family protein [Gammaproteobacteria bacterium]
MLEIRIHGRGGQGNVVAAYLLADAACRARRHCQAFPAFGAERRGAPVTAFVRIARRPIKRRDAVKSPAFLIVQDATLLHEPELVAGLCPGGGILLNTPLSAREVRARHGLEVVTLAASQLAEQHLGRRLPNVALLAAFNRLTGLLPARALEEALAARFRSSVLEQNLALASSAAAGVEAGLWKEQARASGA